MELRFEFRCDLSLSDSLPGKFCLRLWRLGSQRSALARPLALHPTLVPRIGLRIIKLHHDLFFRRIEMALRPSTSKSLRSLAIP